MEIRQTDNHGRHEKEYGRHDAGEAMKVVSEEFVCIAGMGEEPEEPLTGDDQGSCVGVGMK